MATGDFNTYVPKGYVGLLFVEPKGKCSPLPLIDELTRKMTAAYRQAEYPDYAYRGIHCCSCGVFSDNRNPMIQNWVTNSLCIHYLAYHRDEVPMSELEKVASLDMGLAEPSLDELAGPRCESIQPDSSFNGSFAEFLKKGLQ